MMKRYGVKVTLINPGFVKTPITDQNNFKMPFLVTPNIAADKIYNGIVKKNKL